MKNRVQDGTTINIATIAAVASGEPVLVGLVLAVAVAAIPANSTGVGVVDGVFELPKNSAEALGQGVAVYWDSTNKRLTATASDNTLAGKVWVAAANPSPTVMVKINA